MSLDVSGKLRGTHFEGRLETRCQAKDEVIDWLLWRNGTRLHSTLAYVSPMKFEQNWLANQ